MSRKLIGTLLAALIIGAGACAQSAPAPAVAEPAGSSAPGRAAPLPLSEEDAVWRTVAERTGSDLSPVLRPREVPAGLEQVKLLRAGPGEFSVEYTGPEERLTITAGPANPPARAAQERVAVRGNPATLQIEDPLRPADGVSLWWEEPGQWTTGEPKAAIQDRVFYLVSAEGLRPEEVQLTAGSLIAVE
jgi:hypothetical protein